MSGGSPSLLREIPSLEWGVLRSSSTPGSAAESSEASRDLGARSEEGLTVDPQLPCMGKSRGEQQGRRGAMFRARVVENRSVERLRRGLQHRVVTDRGPTTSLRTPSRSSSSRRGRTQVRGAVVGALACLDEVDCPVFRSSPAVQSTHRSLRSSPAGSRREDRVMGLDRHRAEEVGRAAEVALVEVTGRRHLVVGEEFHRRVMGMTLSEGVGRLVEVVDLHRVAEAGLRRAMAVGLRWAAAVGTLVPVDIRLAEVEGHRGAVEAEEVGVDHLQTHSPVAECGTAEVDAACLSLVSRTTAAG